MRDFKRGGKIDRLAKRLKVSRRTVYRWIKEEMINLDLLYEEVIKGEWERPGELRTLMNVSKTSLYSNIDKFPGVLRVGRLIRVNVKTPERVSNENI